MKLYHGTNTDFLEIDLSQSNRFKDFGRGFYLTDIKRQAEEMAKRRVLQNGGMPIVQVYEFDDKCLTDNSINVLKFDRPSAEWAEFVFKNRSRRKPVFKHNYDIVIGPIADDGVAYLLDRYAEGSFTLEQLADELKFKQLNNQYYFGTERAISLLKRLK